MDLLLPLGPASGDVERNDRADDFPTVIECAVPFYFYECVMPTGRAHLRQRAIGIYDRQCPATTAAWPLS